MQNKVIISLHGLKGPQVDDFLPLYEYGKNSLKYSLVRFPYYDNHDKKSIKLSKMDEKISEVISEYKNKNYEIILLGYSLGGTAAIKHAFLNEEIKNLVLVNPAYKLSSWWSWVGDIKRKIDTRKAIIKKLGKERYKKMLAEQKKGKENILANTNNHWGRLLYFSDKYRRKSKKYLKKINNKNVVLFTSKKDHMINKKSNMRYLLKYFNKGNCNIIVNEELNTGHTMLRSGEFEVFDKVINSLNNF